MIGYKVLSVSEDRKTAQVKYFNPDWNQSLVVTETYEEEGTDENGNVSMVTNTRLIDNNTNHHHEHTVVLPDPVEGEEYDLTLRRVIEQIANGVEIKMEIKKRQISESLRAAALNVESNVPVDS